jgi:hypothetical protein
MGPRAMRASPTVAKVESSPLVSVNDTATCECTSVTDTLLFAVGPASTRTCAKPRAMGASTVPAKRVAMAAKRASSVAGTAGEESPSLLQWTPVAPARAASDRVTMAPRTRHPGTERSIMPRVKLALFACPVKTPFR